MEHVIMEATPVPMRVSERVPFLVMTSNVSWACGDHVPHLA